MPSVWPTSAVCVQTLSEYKTVSEWSIVLIFTLSHQSAKRFLSLHFRPVLLFFWCVCVCLCVCQYRDYVKITNMTDFHSLDISKPISFSNRYSSDICGLNLFLIFFFFLNETFCQPRKWTWGRFGQNFNYTLLGCMDSCRHPTGFSN